MAWWREWLGGRAAERRAFLAAQERARVVAAIARAEEGTSGEIRVFTERRCRGEATPRARRVFARLGMTATRRRNGVLIYVAIDDRRFAIVGDEGIHTHVGDAYWEALRDRVAARFREGAFCDGICEAVAEVGAVLRTAFPREPGDVDELPNEPVLSE
jgi:uncharacterized membrane protein